MPREGKGEVVSLDEISFRKVRISDQVEEILKELVLKHNAGDKTPSEDEIARQLSVSKVTVREALGHLEAQGLIERRRGVYGGTFVAKPTSGKMSEVVMNYYRMGHVTPENLVEFRCTLEPTLAMLAAQRITDPEMEELKKNIETIQSELEHGKSDTAKALEFHTLVADACHNPLFSHVMKALTDVFEKVLEQIPLDFEVARYDLDHSKQLYEAFQRRDSAKAYDLMVSHFEKLRQYITNEETTDRTDHGKEGGAL
jgi:GntR family transcriptional regulator, transcriptional repressor for pyruvate dehydrogenase complex